MMVEEDGKAGNLRYEQVESLLLHDLAAKEQRFGLSHPDTATSLKNLVEFYESRGEYEQAELLYRRALAILEQMPEPNLFFDIFLGLNSLASLYKDQGKYEQAE